MEKCRACLESNNLILMDETCFLSYNLLTGLNIIMSENCPYTCKTCHDAINFFIDFRNKCIESNARLQEILSDQTNNELLLKEEFKLESEDVLNRCGYYDEEMGTKSELFDSDTSQKKKHTKEKTEKLKRKSKSIENRSRLQNIHCHSKINCGLCDSKFDDKSELCKHLEYHKSLFNTQLSCGLCSERFTNLPHMLGHRIQHLPEDQRLCHLCCKKFAASSSTCLEFHYMKVHGMADKDAHIQCKQCTSSYSTSRKLIRHVRDCHYAPRYHCRLCKKSFRNKTLLNIHNKMKHTDGNRVKCELCDFSSKYANSLMLHTRRKHTSNTFNCKACYRVFVDEASLTRHVADVCKHHARVVCSVCGHTVKKVWLKNHMRSHSDEYPFKCDKCPAQYKYRTGLKDHKDKHEGTLSFHCELCTKSFCIKSALQSHKRTHEGVKPFVCDICKACFKRRYNLKAHMNAHPWSSSEYSKEKKI